MRPIQQERNYSYEELKIRDGPLYSIKAPKRNETTQCMLEYERGNLPQEQGQQNDEVSIPAVLSSASSDDTITANYPSSRASVSPTTFTSKFNEDYWFSTHRYRPSALRAESTALLIVDVQPEYWSNCPAVRKDFSEFPQRLGKTIEICRSRRAKIIWVRADYRYSHSPWLLQFERIRGPRNLGEVPCDPDSPDFTWEDFATPQGGEVIIAKSSWSSTSNTALMDILRVAGIETVLVCGLITSVCVQHSAFGIFEAGYRTLLVTDACADRGKARHEAALALYGDYMYELVTSDDLESKETGLVPAEPIWLMLDSKTRMVRANSFPKQPLKGAAGACTLTVPMAPPMQYQAPKLLKSVTSPSIANLSSTNTSTTGVSEVSPGTPSSSHAVMSKALSSSCTASTASTSSNSDVDEDDDDEKDKEEPFREASSSSASSTPSLTTTAPAINVICVPVVSTGDRLA